MAKNVTLLGADYPDVPAVELPQTGGGTATFTDVSDTTATANDVLSGKSFYTASGLKASGAISVPAVVDNLTSTSTTDALSANQGRELYDKISTVETITGPELFDAVDTSVAEFYLQDTIFYKQGRIVCGMFRIHLKSNTSGSTKLFTPKTSALKDKWYPASYSNYAVFLGFTTWDAAQHALFFLNDTWDFGIGKATAGQYVGTFTYLART